jgi:hypothetical protein
MVMVMVMVILHHGVIPAMELLRFTGNIHFP